MDVSLKNHRLILIGGSGALGTSLLEKMLYEGAIVGVTYNKNEIKLSDSLAKYENNLFVQHLDVTDTQKFHLSLGELIKKLEWVDGIVYNAGIADDSIFLDMTLTQWKNVLNVNLDGAFLAAQLVSQKMKERKKGKIINISSYRGIVGSAEQCNYSASKAAVNVLTKSIARELGQYGIAVNAVCPGFMLSKLNKDNHEKQRRAISDSLLSRISTPDEIANFIIYLLSDMAVNISGQIFQVDSRI